jgi:Arc/MetJ-type ribon-helix-helix transcriptional regulator
MMPYERCEESITIRVTHVQAEILRHLIDNKRWYSLSDVVCTAIDKLIREEQAKFVEASSPISQAQNGMGKNRVSEIEGKL